ncbi:DUF3152 domain-containing protein [Streptomyces sp. NPDC056254]|uniref:DUF3152 domain-containing protein n=1 Tax=unclassified Streptomyces TaxID=2593676 RepID=UPI0005ECCB91|nr:MULTISPECIES: DUF3152 domain-containing protein [unclassified Streptomyces]APU41607.1 hypothetical protein BSL84_19470 [Streptomyces sp. TN58]KJK48354.1 membrane protein [Streptomyces sp. NRRL F-4428]
MPAGHSTGRSRRDGPRARRRAERRRRLRRTILIGSAALVAVSATAYALLPEDDTTTAAKGRSAAQPDAPDGEGTDAAGNPLPQGGAKSPEAAPPPAAPSQQPAASPPASAGASATPGKPGTFSGSSASGSAQGKGKTRRWRLEVEEGSGIDPEAAARSVEAILGDPRGWTRDPQYGFQLVGPGQPVDFTVKIATPKTTDLLCDVVTPELIGETNCRVGHTVVVNLKRWKEGSPQFSGSVEEYRALIVNHEVGHEIGRGHEGCPGPGKPAPAMMQQIKGLAGCKSNAWPYDADGTYLSGPSVL